VEHDLFGKPVATFPDHAVERDGFKLNRHRALDIWWSMIFLRKPVATFPDHALANSAISASFRLTITFDSGHSRANGLKRTASARAAPPARFDPLSSLLIVLRQRRQPLLRCAVSPVRASIECVSAVACRRSAFA
jgi:hypothetical protein